MMPPRRPKCSTGGVVYGEAYIFYHLAGVKLYAEDAFLALCGFGDSLCGKAIV